jgi:hypothetical protein
MVEDKLGRPAQWE